MTPLDQIAALERCLRRSEDLLPALRALSRGSFPSTAGRAASAVKREIEALRLAIARLRELL